MIMARPATDGAAHALRQAIEDEESLRARHTPIILTPLRSEDSILLAESLLEGGTLPLPVRKLLQDRAAGNPFFMGEIVRTLLATGAVVRDSVTGQLEATARLIAAPLPETIEGVILERIDRLEDEAKQVLKAAAVVGRSFFYRVLQAVADASAALDEDLRKLQKTELILERKRLPELEYMFQHPLVQQATYNSILEDRKRQLHRQVGETIEALFAGRIEEFYPVLAHHFAQARDWDRAQHYLFKSGDQAGSIAADAEALEHYRDALATAEKVGAIIDPVERAALDRKIGEALFRLGQHELSLSYLTGALQRLGIDYPKSARTRAVAIVKLITRLAVGRALRTLRLLRDDPGPPGRELVTRTQCLELVCVIEFYRDPQRFLLSLLYGLAQVERHPRLPIYTTLVSACGLILDMAGLYRVARRFHDRARDVTDLLGDPYRTHYSRILRGIHEHASGDWDSAEASFTSASRGMRTLGHLRHWTIATNSHMLLLESRGDPRWLDLPNEQHQVAAETGDNHMLAWATLGAGRARLFQGDSKDAANQLSRACELLESVPDHQLLPCALAQLAFALVKLGRLQESFPLLDRSREIRRRYSVRGTLATGPLLTTAETYLMALERLDLPAASRPALLDRASSACKDAMRHGRSVRDHAEPSALRLQGMLEWLRGDRAAARRMWSRSCEVAERIGARHVLAQAHFEIGRRFELRDHLETAEQLFLVGGALAELTRTRRALTGAGLTRSPSANQAAPP